MANALHYRSSRSRLTPEEVFHEPVAFMFDRFFSPLPTEADTV
jgi:hypothetical protein